LEWYMAKIENSRAAVRRYIIRRSPVDGAPSPDVPDKCGPVHAVLVQAPSRWEQHKLEKLARHRGIQFIEWEWNAPYSMCGVQVRVVYPMTFDTDEDDACPECKALAAIRSIDPAEYMRQAAQVAQRRRQREQRRLIRDRQRKGHDRFIEQLEDAAAEPELGVMSPKVDPRHPGNWLFPDLNRNGNESEADGLA
ncbi:hypothetical protein ABQE57_25850, partial [Mycolicibacterium elephantis]